MIQPIELTRQGKQRTSFVKFAGQHRRPELSDFEYWRVPASTTSLGRIYLVASTGKLLLAKTAANAAAAVAVAAPPARCCPHYWRRRRAGDREQRARLCTPPLAGRAAVTRAGRGVPRLQLSVGALVPEVPCAGPDRKLRAQWGAVGRVHAARWRAGHVAPDGAHALGGGPVQRRRDGDLELGRWRLRGRHALQVLHLLRHT